MIGETTRNFTIEIFPRRVRFLADQLLMVFFIFSIFSPKLMLPSFISEVEKRTPRAWTLPLAQAIGLFDGMEKSLSLL